MFSVNHIDFGYFSFQKKTKIVPGYGTVVLGELDEADLKGHGAHCQDVYYLKI